MAAEDIGAATGNTHIAQRQLERAVSAGIVVTDSVLGAAHTPDEGAGTVIRHRLGCREDLVFRHAGDIFDFLGIPFPDFGHDLVHTVDTLADEFLVFPAVLENVPHHAPDNTDIGAGADAQEVIGVCSGAGVARIDDDHRRIILFLGLEDVLQCDRMRLGRVGTDQQYRLGKVDIVVRVRHRTVTPGIGYPGYRRGVTDTRLVIDIIGAPHGGEFTEQVGLFIAVLG